MKKIFITTLILTFFCDSLLSQSLPSPSSGPAGIFDRTDSRLMNAMTDLTNRRARKAATPAGVKGSYYFNENFQLSTEEWVRQHCIHYLIFIKHYPKSLINVEKKILVNGVPKRYDIIIFSKNGEVLLIVECKEPKRLMFSGIVNIIHF